jgi:hypothetical protein
MAFLKVNYLFWILSFLAVLLAYLVSISATIPTLLTTGILGVIVSLGVKAFDTSQKSKEDIDKVKQELIVSESNRIISELKLFISEGVEKKVTALDTKFSGKFDLLVQELELKNVIETKKR